MRVLALSKNQDFCIKMSQTILYFTLTKDRNIAEYSVLSGMSGLDWTRNKNLPPPFAQSQGIICRLFVLYNVTMALSQGFLNGIPLLIGGNKRKYKAWRPVSYQSVQLTCKKENMNISFILHLNEAHIPSRQGLASPSYSQKIGCGRGKYTSIIRSLLDLIIRSYY